jgi:uncharacterized protein YjiS (DUF1127 family)
MTNLNATALQEPKVAYDRQVARAVARTAALILVPLVQAFRARRDAEHLMGMSDHLLKDIGVARCEIETAVRWGQARR